GRAGRPAAIGEVEGPGRGVRRDVQDGVSRVLGQRGGLAHRVGRGGLDGAGGGRDGAGLDAGRGDARDHGGGVAVVDRDRGRDRGRVGDGGVLDLPPVAVVGELIHVRGRAQRGGEERERRQGGAVVI